MYENICFAVLGELCQVLFKNISKKEILTPTLPSFCFCHVCLCVAIN